MVETTRRDYVKQLIGAIDALHEGCKERQSLQDVEVVAPVISEELKFQIEKADSLIFEKKQHLDEAFNQWNAGRYPKWG